MTVDFIYQLIKQHNLAVISTVAKNEQPQSALIGIAVSNRLEIVFDTVKSSRKYQNLLRNPPVSLVIGWDDEITVQYEGIATELNNEADGAYKELYFAAFNGGSERAETWPDIAHFKITPHWIRYSNFNKPDVIEELNGPF